jgi:hypothetical protein
VTLARSRFLSSVSTTASLLGQGGGPVLGRAQQAVLQVVEFNGGVVLNLKAELAAPLDEGAARDAKLGGDPEKAPTLGRRSTNF